MPLYFPIWNFGKSHSNKRIWNKDQVYASFKWHLSIDNGPNQQWLVAVPSLIRIGTGLPTHTKLKWKRLSNNLHKASEIPIESREYLDPFSRGISQHLAHADAMLGPKRPQSAARDSSKQKGHVLATTHVSKKTKPKDQHNMSDELNEEDEAILNIRCHKNMHSIALS